MRNKSEADCGGEQEKTRQTRYKGEIIQADKAGVQFVTTTPAEQLPASLNLPLSPPPLWLCTHGCKFLFYPHFQLFSLVSAIAAHRNSCPDDLFSALTCKTNMSWFNPFGILIVNVEKKKCFFFFSSPLRTSHVNFVTTKIDKTERSSNF